MRLLGSAIVLCILSACGGGGGGDPVVQDLTIETSPDTTKLESLMVASSPTKSKDFYLLPDSDDYDNIPQDPLNPLQTQRLRWES